MASEAQRVRILLTRMVARENKRPVRLADVLDEAAREGIPRAAAEDALARLARDGHVMRSRSGDLQLRPPTPPRDVTPDRAKRMRLYADAEAHNNPTESC